MNRKDLGRSTDPRQERATTPTPCNPSVALPLPLPRPPPPASRSFLRLTIPREAYATPHTNIFIGTRGRTHARARSFAHTHTHTHTRARARAGERPPTLLAYLHPRMRVSANVRHQAMHRLTPRFLSASRSRTSLSELYVIAVERAAIHKHTRTRRRVRVGR